MPLAGLLPPWQPLMLQPLPLKMTVWMAAKLALGAASLVRAESDEPRPYMYTWAAPTTSGGWDPTLTQHVSQMVRIRVNEYATPGAAAQEARRLALEQIYGDANHVPRIYPTTDINHVCILLQNYGNLMPGGNPTSFLDVADALGDPPSGWDQNDPNVDIYKYMQPWMDAGRATSPATLSALMLQSVMKALR